jgi:hypothetical protein
MMSDAPDTTEPFDYATAFSRTIGWITATEQAKLRSRRVAIAGLGGVGGSHLLTLARLGIQSFNLADLDRFGTENLNRQAGAFQSTIGQPKIDVVSRMARDINPDPQPAGARRRCKRVVPYRIGAAVATFQETAPAIKCSSGNRAHIERFHLVVNLEFNKEFPT